MKFPCSITFHLKQLLNETVEKPFFAGRNIPEDVQKFVFKVGCSWDWDIHHLELLDAPKVWIFPILRAFATSANRVRIHCTSTLDFERKVNRFMWF